MLLAMRMPVCCPQIPCYPGFVVAILGLFAFAFALALSSSRLAPRSTWVAWVPVEGHVANIPIFLAGDYLVIRGDYQANSFCGIMI